MNTYRLHQMGDCDPHTCPVCAQECDRCGHLGRPCKCDEARYFLDDDGDNEPTLWHQIGDDDPMPVLRRCDVLGDDRDEHWERIVAGVTT